jgi:hypothetical protein
MAGKWAGKWTGNERPNLTSDKESEYFTQLHNRSNSTQKWCCSKRGVNWYNVFCRMAICRMASCRTTYCRKCKFRQKCRTINFLISTIHLSFDNSEFYCLVFNIET